MLRRIGLAAAVVTVIGLAPQSVQARGGHGGHGGFARGFSHNYFMPSFSPGTGMSSPTTSRRAARTSKNYTTSTASTNLASSATSTTGNWSKRNSSNTTAGSSTKTPAGTTNATPAPCMQAIDGRPLTALQVELLAMFTPEMRSQFDQAPAEMRAEILRTFKSGIIAPGAFDMVRIKLANLGAYTPAAAVLAEVLGSPAVTQAPVATQAAAVPVMASGPLDDDRALYEALRSLSPGTPKIEVQRIALRLTVLLEDRHSYPFWVGVVRDARQGVLPVDLIINGLEKRKDPAVDSPARVATAMVSKFRGQRASKFQAPRRQPCPRA